MSELYELTGEIRTEVGKGSNRRLRRLTNRVPAIVYGGNKNPETISLDHNTLLHALGNEGLYSHILTLNVAGKKEKVVLKDLLRHPSEPKILHVDFLRVSAKNKLTMNVPLHFTGGDVALGVKDQGGMVSHLMTEVEIRCLPGDLPEYIDVDLSKLSLGESIHLSQLEIPEGVEITVLLQGEEFDQPVANIHKPIVTQEPVAVIEEEPAQPEVISQKSEAEGT